MVDLAVAVLVPVCVGFAGIVWAACLLGGHPPAAVRDSERSGMQRMLRTSVRAISSGSPGAVGLAAAFVGLLLLATTVIS
jgi:hypothetical protein